MGFRYRKQIKILPGVKLNVTKHGVSSVSVGKRGCTANINKKGVMGTFGVPGSGMSYQTKRYGGNKKNTISNRLDSKVAEVESYRQIPFAIDWIKYPKILCIEWIGIILGFILGFTIHPAIFVLTFIPLIMALFTSIFNKQLKAKNNQLKAVRSYQKNNMIDCVNRCKKSLKYMNNESTKQLMELAEQEINKCRAE